MQPFNSLKEYQEQADASFKAWFEKSIEEFFAERESPKEDDISQEQIYSSIPVIEIEPNEIRIEPEPIEALSSITQTSDALLERVNSDEIIQDKKPEEEKKEVRPGLNFDHLVSSDPEAEMAKHPEYVLPTVPETSIRLKDNLDVISNFPEMNRIQEIVRNLGMDIEMIPLYEKFILCLIISDNQQIPSKSFVVDYEGNYMNKIPKIFLSVVGAFVDQWPAIHFNDNKNLVNHLKGLQVIQTPKPIVTKSQRMVGRYIINYPYSKIIPDNDVTAFENVCITEIIPHIQNNIQPSIASDCSFRITEFSNPGVWSMVCDSKTPYRFGEMESLTNKVIYIKGAGFDDNGRIIINQDII